MKKIIYLLIFLFSAASSGAAELSNLADHSSNIQFSPEQNLGKEFMRYVRANYLLLSDPLIGSYIQSLGLRLLANNSVPNNSFHFFVVQDSSINAFSGPAGNIGINTGLIAATESESELAAVLAHEIAHSTQKHIMRGIEKEKSMLIPEAAALAAAIALGAASHSGSAASAATGAALAAMAGGSQYEINFTRDFEREADRIGMQTLYKSDFDPLAMPEFFARIERRNLNFNEEVPAFLLNHPVTAERIADAKNRASQFPKRKVKVNDDYYLMKARLKAVANKANYQLLDHFKIDMQDKNDAQRIAAQYGYALALKNTFHYKEAEEAINSLIKKYPDKPIYKMALGEIKTAENEPLLARSILKKILALNPEYYPAIVQYGQILLDAKQFQNAENFLQAQSMNYPDDVMIYSLLMQAQARCRHFAAAYRSRAKMLSLFGYDKDADVLFEQAKKIDAADHLQRH